MADDDKMSRVKESLRTMLTKLRPEDIVSIVAFDSSAQVLYPGMALVCVWKRSTVTSLRMLTEKSPSYWTI